MIRVFASFVSIALLAGCMTQPPAPAVDRTSGMQSRSAAVAAPVPSGPGYYTVKRGDTLYRIALDNGQDYREIAAWNNLANPGAIKEGQVLRVLPPGASAAPASNGVVAQPVATTSVVETQSLDTPKPVATAPAVSGAAGAQKEPRGGKEPYSDEAYARLSRNGDSAPKPAVVAVDSKNEPKTEAPASKPEVKAEPKSEASATANVDDVVWQWPSSGKVVQPFSESGNKGLDFGGKPGDPVLAAADGKVVYAGTGLRGYGELVIVKHNATYLSAYAHNRKILVKEGQQVSRGQKIAEMGNTDSETVKLHFEIRKQGKSVDPVQYLPKR